MKQCPLVVSTNFYKSGHLTDGAVSKFTHSQDNFIFTQDLLGWRPKQLLGELLRR